MSQENKKNIILSESQRKMDSGLFAQPMREKLDFSKTDEERLRLKEMKKALVNKSLKRI